MPSLKKKKVNIIITEKILVVDFDDRLLQDVVRINQSHLVLLNITCSLYHGFSSGIRDYFRFRSSVKRNCHCCTIDPTINVLFVNNTYFHLNLATKISFYEMGGI